MAAAMLMEQKLEYGKLMLPNSRPTSAMADLRLQSRLRLDWAKARAEAHTSITKMRLTLAMAGLPDPPKLFQRRPLLELAISGSSACAQHPATPLPAIAEHPCSLR